MASPLTKLPSIPTYRGLNPFVDNYSTINLWREKLKIFLFTITLIAPIRQLLLILIPILTLIYILIVTAGYNSSQPISPNSIRGKLLQLLRYPCYVFCAVGGFYNVKLIKHKGCDMNARIFISNHVSVWDAFFYFALTGCCFLTRDDVFKIPFFGQSIKYGVQCVGIDRSTEIGRKNAINIIGHHVNNDKAPSLLIFPTGTTCNQNILITFKTGSFVNGLPVQPLILKYNNKYSNLGFSANYTMFTVMYYSLCQFVNYIEIIALPLYKPNDDEINNPKLFANNVRKEMAKYLNAKITDHIDTDCSLYVYMKDYNILSKTKFLINHVSKKFGLHHTSFIKLAKSFKKYNYSRSGTLNINEFSKIFGIENIKDDNNNIIQKIFNMVVSTNNDDDKMGYDEFIVLISIMLSPKSINKTAMISLLFHCLDIDNDGIIKKTNLYLLTQQYKQSIFYKNDNNKYDTELFDTLFNNDNHNELQFGEFEKKLLNNYDLIYRINCYILQEIIKLNQFDKIKQRIK